MMDVLTHTLEDRVTVEVEEETLLRFIFTDMRQLRFDAGEPWAEELDPQEWYIDSVERVPVDDDVRATFRIVFTRIADYGISGYTRLSSKENTDE